MKSKGGGQVGKQSAPEAGSFLAFARSKARQICPFLLIFGKFMGVDHRVDRGTCLLYFSK